MTESSFPFDNSNVFQDSWQQMGRIFAPNIVENPNFYVDQSGDPEASLFMEPAGGFTTVLYAGNAWVQGFAYRNDSPKIITHANPPGSPSQSRYDMVALRLDKTLGTVRVQVTAGVAATTPVLPLPYQLTPAGIDTTTIFEMPLYFVKVAGGTTVINGQTMLDVRNLYSPARGPVQYTIGPNLAIDCGPARATILNQKMYFERSRSIWFLSNLFASQITAAGVPYCALYIDGVEIRRFAGASNSSQVGQNFAVIGCLSEIWVPPDTKLFTVQVVAGNTTGAATRVQPNGLDFKVIDLGQYPPLNSLIA